MDSAVDALVRIAALLGDALTGPGLPLSTVVLVGLLGAATTERALLRRRLSAA